MNISIFNVLFSHFKKFFPHLKLHLRSFHFPSFDVDGGSVQLLSHVLLFATPRTAAQPGLPVHHQLLEFNQTHEKKKKNSVHFRPSLLISLKIKRAI